MVLDRNGSACDALVERLLTLEAEGAIHFIQPGHGLQAGEAPQDSGRGALGDERGGVHDRPSRPRGERPEACLVERRHHGRGPTGNVPARSSA
jgi:hypothetical protein